MHILGMGCGAEDSGKEVGKEPEPQGEALQWWSSTLETQENLLVPVAVLEAERNNLKGFPGKSRSLTPLEN